jgi:surface antigen
MIRKPVAAVLALSLGLCSCDYFKSMETETGVSSKPAVNAGDQKQINDAMQKAYTSPIGQPVTWNNPESGDSGTIVAIRDGYSQERAYCRRFQNTVTAGGHATKTNSDFCQMPDGSWKAVPPQ